MGVIGTTRVGRVVTWWIVAGVSFVACQSPPAKEPNGGPTATTTGSGHACDRGRDLTADDARPWQEKWDGIEAARKTGAVGDGSAACRTAKEFVATCPRWSERLSDVYGEVCATKRISVAVAKEEPAKPGCPAAWMTTPEAGKLVRQKITDTLRRDLGIASLKDPNEARRVLNEVKWIDMKHLHCDDEDSAKELEPVVDKWVADAEAAIDEEIKCRVSDECRARRIANQICATIADKKEAQQQIATERANPGGVVSLRTLHDLGERIQYDDASIASLKSDYTALAKKPFNAGACSR